MFRFREQGSCSLTHHNAGGADDFAGDPADALEGEHGVDFIGEGFVLKVQVRKGCAECCSWRGLLTKANLPDRLEMVTCAGAAMVSGLWNSR